MRRHQARLNPSHVLVHSKIMELAMSVVAMLAGVLTASIRVMEQAAFGTTVAKCGVERAVYK
ncbi:MAG TPA: hypothetical protein VHW01_16335 [Polyangiaceae bacterium]|jgi:hypothetical protein|nr:hypothetical protein [Polyangiaceae bacterium]